MRYIRQTVLLVFVAVLMLCGCEGPVTRVLPGEPVTVVQVDEVQEEAMVLEEVNPFYIQESLDKLASQERATGSTGNRSAAAYCSQLLKQYGYRVNRQYFAGSPDAAFQSVNYIAVRHPEKMTEQTPILLISSHMDSVPGSRGANDAAAGLAGWLEAARLLSRIPTNIELRFVSYDQETEDARGSSYYMESLPETDRRRIIGEISFDMMGYAGDYVTVMQTSDGVPNLLTEKLLMNVMDIYGDDWKCQKDFPGAHRNLHGSVFPVVVLGQDVQCFEYHTVQDRPAIIDSEKTGRIVDVVVKAVSDLMEHPPAIQAVGRSYMTSQTAAHLEAAAEKLPPVQEQITQLYQQILRPEERERIFDLQFVDEQTDEKLSHELTLLQTNDGLQLMILLSEVEADATHLKNRTELINALVRLYIELNPPSQDELENYLEFIAEPDRTAAEAVIDEKPLVEEQTEEDQAALVFDYAEAFRLYVLTGEPETTTMTRDRKIIYFYHNPDWSDIRTYIRTNLELDRR